MSREESFNFLEILSDIEEEYVREAGTEGNAVQPQFIQPRPKTKKPIFAIAGIAACFALIFAIGIAVSRNSGIEITQTLPPINTGETQTLPSINTTETQTLPPVNTAETQTTSAEITTSNETIRPFYENKMVTSVPAVKETADTRIAVDFIHDFYATLSTHDESILDLDKYFNDGDLKDRMAECKNKLLKNNDFYEKENFAIDYAAAVSDKRIDGDVHQITVAYTYKYLTKPNDYENPQNNDWTESGMNAPFAIKDGKILNFAVEDYFEALSPNENVPEVQIIQSHITNVFTNSGTRVFELDGISYECDPDVKTYDCISEKRGVLKIITPEGNIGLKVYKGEWDEILEALQNIYLLDYGALGSRSAGCLGNTGRISVNGINFIDAYLYRCKNNKRMIFGYAPENCPAGCDPEKYLAAVLLQPETTPAEAKPPNNWYNEGYIIPENWLPIMKNNEAFENLDSLFNEPQEGKSLPEIIQNLVNRNIVAIDIFYGRAPAFDIDYDYKVEEPNFGVVNSRTGKTDVYAVKSDYFSTIEELENVMAKTYTADLAHKLLYERGTLYIEKDNQLFVDLNCMYIWSNFPFEDDAYIEILTDDENECFFNYHYIMWEYFDYENNDTDKLYPHHNIIALRAVKENGEWRLCSPVFSNPGLDYIKDTANLISLLEKIIGRAKTVEEMTAKLNALHGGYVVTKVSVYKNSTEYKNGAAPITTGVLESGMYVRVDYYENSYFEMTIS